MHTPPDLSALEAAAIFATIARSSTKLHLLMLLAEEPQHVKALAEQVLGDQSSVSHHLKALREHSLVEAVRAKQYVRYELTSNTVVNFGSKHITVTIRDPDRDIEVSVVIPTTADRVIESKPEPSNRLTYIRKRTKS